MDTCSLPAYRLEAINGYFDLVERCPEHFEPRAHRPLVLDRDEAIAIATDCFDREGADAAVIGLAARTLWHLFLTDLVQLPDGTITTYDRLVPTSLLTNSIGVAVVAMARTTRGDIGLVLVRQERHATGQLHWEIPRGFGESHISAEELARRELEEETGFTGTAIKRLATMHTNTGQTAEPVHYIMLEAHQNAGAKPEHSEAILEARVWSRAELWQAISSGEITDTFTLSGLALFERYHIEEG